MSRGVKQAMLRQTAEGELVKKGDLYILTSVETLGVGAKVVRWRMPKARVQAMKAAKWGFVAHRFDSDADDEYQCAIFTNLRADCRVVRHTGFIPGMDRSQPDADEAVGLSCLS